MADGAPRSPADKLDSVLASVRENAAALGYVLEEVVVRPVRAAQQDVFPQQQQQFHPHHRHHRHHHQHHHYSQQLGLQEQLHQEHAPPPQPPQQQQASNPYRPFQAQEFMPDQPPQYPQSQSQYADVASSSMFPLPLQQHHHLPQYQNQQQLYQHHQHLPYIPQHQPPQYPASGHQEEYTQAKQENAPGKAVRLSSW
jgi:hypothetical protein